MMTKIVNRFAKDESGATAIEYGLIAAGISVAISRQGPLTGTNWIWDAYAVHGAR
jgi:pilus assembly protein Flp/PilA